MKGVLERQARSLIEAFAKIFSHDRSRADLLSTWSKRMGTRLERCSNSIRLRAGAWRSGTRRVRTSLVNGRNMDDRLGKYSLIIRPTAWTPYDVGGTQTGSL